MNTVLKARLRQKLILQSLSFFHYLLTSHLVSLAFRFPTGQTKAQMVLKKMYKEGLVRRFRECPHGEYVYHLGRKTPAWQSILALNKLYFDMDTKGKVLKFQPELEFFSGRCDGFFVVEYSGKRKKFFCEIDRGTTAFKKADIYNNLLQTDWESEWWADPLKRGVISFPLVVVVTLRRETVERDFMKAKFEYVILDFFKPQWEVIFKNPR